MAGDLDGSIDGNVHGQQLGGMADGQRPGESLSEVPDFQKSSPNELILSIQYKNLAIGCKTTSCLGYAIVLPRRMDTGHTRGEAGHGG